MFRTLYCLEIFMLLFLIHLGRNFPSNNLFECSRTKSQVVRMLVHKKILPILLRYKLSLPLSCPFHHKRDALWWPNVQFDFFEGNWRCPFCAALFSSEEVVVDHWDKHHLIGNSEDSVCVAKFCDIFRCEVILASMKPDANILSSNTLPNLYNTKNSLIPCDQEKMFQLQNKCKIVMHHCLSGILSFASVKDFQDIDEEVSLAICSYLTCQNYLDASLNVIQPASPLFNIITGAVLVAAFLLCYYLVYSVSNPMLLNPESFCNGVSKPHLRFKKNGDIYRGQRPYRYVPQT